MNSRAACIERDAADQLALLRDQFELPMGMIYLDGNSLGALPRSVRPRIQHVVEQQWGAELVGSWNSAGWLQLPFVVGDKIGRLIGAEANEVIVADSTSVNLFKVLTAAISIARGDSRTTILSDHANFPSDLYIAASVADAAGMTLRLVDADDVAGALDDSIAVLMLTEVNYRTGAMFDMAALNDAARACGILTVWDLAHSAGAVAVDLTGADADFAVGCGYKYLNGGPGAPGFLWVHQRHVDQFRQPLAGWFGHEAAFDFVAEYRPAAGIARYQCGTPPILSLAALECGVDSVLAASTVGGVAAIRRKSEELTALFIDLARPLCEEFGFSIATPLDPARRGSQVSLIHPTHGYEIVQALIVRGVVGDFRAPDMLRFGLAPLYTRFVDVWDAVENLRSVMLGEEWRDRRFAIRSRVT